MTDEIFSDYWTESEYAAARDCCVRTIQREREEGRGAPYVKVGRTVRYRKSAVRDWLLRREVQPVREAV